MPAMQASSPLAALKNEIKKRPWLYKSHLWTYFFITHNAAKAARALHTFILKIKHAIRDRPTLAAYLPHVKNFLKGKTTEGSRGLAQELSRGFRQFVTSHNPIHALQVKLIYQEALLSCVRRRVYGWWKIHDFWHFNSITTLHLFLREYVLRRAGDYRAYIKLKNRLNNILKIFTDSEPFLEEMVQHFSTAMDEADALLLGKLLATPLKKRPFLIGVSVWGEHYLHMMLHYCLPSLLTEGNLETLCRERQPIFLIHTNHDGKLRLTQHPLMRRIAETGALVHYRLLDDGLLRRLSEDLNYKYWHLGMVQSLDLHYAKKWNSDYHLLMPDIIYSNRYFEGMLRAAEHGHPVILKVAYRTRMEGVGPAIEAFRKGDSISIPAADLTALSIAHLHAASHALVMTNKNIEKQLPGVHVVIWEGKDTLHALSPHQTIVYLDRALVQQLPKRLFMTLDSEIDKIVPENCPVYCPKKEDGIFVIEVSPDNITHTPASENTTENFCDMFWYNVESPAHLRFFNEDIVAPLNRNAMPERPYMAEAAIEEAEEKIRTAVKTSFPGISVSTMTHGLRALSNAAKHPQAQMLRDELRATAQQIWLAGKERLAQGKNLSFTETELAELLDYFGLNKETQTAQEPLYSAPGL